MAEGWGGRVRETWREYIEFDFIHRKVGLISTGSMMGWLVSNAWWTVQNSTWMNEKNEIMEFSPSWAKPEKKPTIKGWFLTSTHPLRMWIIIKGKKGYCIRLLGWHIGRRLLLHGGKSVYAAGSLNLSLSLSLHIYQWNDVDLSDGFSLLKLANTLRDATDFLYRFNNGDLMIFLTHKRGFFFL